MRRWNSLWEEAAANGDANWPECEGCRYGQGGGIFIMFRNSTHKTAVTIRMESTEIVNNSASVGGAALHGWDGFPFSLVVGGVYVRNELGHQLHEQLGDCAIDLKKGMSCLSIQYKNVVIANNLATLSGGGLFLSASLDVSQYCKMPLSRSRAACIPYRQRRDSRYLLSIYNNRFEVCRKAFLRERCSFQPFLFRVSISWMEDTVTTLPVMPMLSSYKMCKERSPGYKMANCSECRNLPTGMPNHVRKLHCM